MKAVQISFLALGFASSAAAQSIVSGVDLRLGDAFTTETLDYVNQYTMLAQESRDIYGLDWTADGTTLYGIDDDSLEIVSIDPATGLSTPTGPFLVGPGTTGLTGLTSSPDGSTWYLSNYDGFDSFLYVGDIVTGIFTLVGFINDGIVIDIAMSPTGELYAFSISDDSLYSVDLTSGLGTAIGPVGLDANFAQGMDFDPSTGILYAAIYTGGGTGQFCSLDLTTGLANQLEDTTILNAEMEIAIRPDMSGPIGNPYCMANANSTGVAATMDASGSNVVADNDLSLIAAALPTNAFGFFIVSDTQGFVANPGGSSGNLCVLGQVGRYVGSGQIQNSGSAGSFTLQVDLTMIPQPNGTVSTSAGDTWNFQAWYRDSSPMGPTSNFTNGYEIIFQ